MSDEQPVEGLEDKPCREFFSKSFNSFDLLDFDNDFIENLGRKGRSPRVNSCTFRSAVFIRCYFRGVTFTNCDFTSARFIECNFKGAKFVHCKFDYAMFRRTIVDSEEVIANLPLEPNVRRDLLRNLRVDARELGSVEDEGLYIRHEIDASDLFCINVFKGKGEYYRNKYGALERIGFLGQWLQSKVSGLVWGNGEKPLRVLYACFFTIAMISMILLWFGYSIKSFPQGSNFYLNFMMSLRLSVSEFLGVPYNVDSFPLQVPFLVSVVAVFLRYVFIGLLVSVMFRSFSRR